MNRFKNWLSLRTAGTALLLVFTAAFIFHVLIITRIISIEQVWGGQIQQDQLIFFESAAIIILILFSWIVAIKSQILKWKAPHLILRFGPWVLFTYLLINTVGNLAGTGTETLLFAPVILLLCILSFRLAIER